MQRSLEAHNTWDWKWIVDLEKQTAFRYLDIVLKSIRTSQRKVQHNRSYLVEQQTLYRICISKFIEKGEVIDSKNKLSNTTNWASNGQKQPQMKTNGWFFYSESDTCQYTSWSDF